MTTDEKISLEELKENLSLMKKHYNKLSERKKKMIKNGENVNSLINKMSDLVSEIYDVELQIKKLESEKTDSSDKRRIFKSGDYYAPNFDIFSCLEKNGFIHANLL